MSGASRREKWSGRRVQERHNLAAERRKISKEPSADDRRVLELTISRKVVDPKFLDAEPDLATTRWVAYGYMTPLECTELFCREYLATYRRLYGKYRDSLTADEQMPIDAELLRNERDEINSFWHARQIADEIGMPYDYYLSRVMDWAGNQRRRKQLPRPNQLYHSQQVEIAYNGWLAVKDEAVSLFADDWDDRFFRQNPKIDPPRRKALILAFDKLNNRMRRTGVLANLIGRWDALSERAARHIAITRFPDQPDLLDDAKKMAVPPRKERTATAFNRYLPPCLGMRQDITTSSCSGCTFMLECQKARTTSNEQLQAQTGSVNPIADKKRTDAANRQRRKRDRDRAARAGGSLALKAG